MTRKALREPPSGTVGAGAGPTGWEGGLGWSPAVALAVLAFGLRLMPWLRGGGLYGLGRYDDGVYFAAAVALVHGQLPYRDFLFLHPPGIVLTLTPFAALGLVTTEGTGLAAARLGWMLLGALSTALVVRVLGRVGRFAAVLGGSCYAVFPPALQAELGTQLQAPANACLLVALLLLTARPGRGGPRRRQTLVAGVVLGLSVTVKLWGVVALVLLVGWLLTDHRVAGSPLPPSSGSATRSGDTAVRRAVLLLAGSAAAATAVCLPFFLAAPGAMWLQVIAAQLGRSRFSPEVVVRLVDILGLRSLVPDPEQPGPAVLPLLVTALLLVALRLAWSVSVTRPAVVLALGLGLLLLSTPPWFPFYAALTAPVLALVLGAAGQQLVRRAAKWRRPGRPPAALAVGLALLAAVGGFAVASARLTFGRPFPGEEFGRVVATRPGCVTSDTPAALVLMDALGRNISRGCRLVIDPGGYSYLLHPEQGNLTRHLDPEWQELVVTYLRSGTASVVATYRLESGFSAETVAELDRWPTLTEAGRFRLAAPPAP